MDTYKKAYGRDPNSTGMTPILYHGDYCLTQSDLVAWYICEAFPDKGPQLIPNDPYEKMRMRNFLQTVPGKVVAGFGCFKKFLGKSP